MGDKQFAGKVVLITGGAHRIGARLVRHLHAAGMNIVLHYRSSEKYAHALQSELQAQRPDSVVLVRGDLTNIGVLTNLVYETVEAFGRLDVLINNASVFYPTPVGEASEKEWDDLMGTNLKAPFFLSQAAYPALKKASGCIVNIADIYGDRPLKNYPIYSTAKAGLIMLTQSLARELGPDVRVNAIAPGVILWPENDMDDMTKQRLINSTPLKRSGDPDDIAHTVSFLIGDAGFITGQVIAVDGGRWVVL
jgi:pteridine reductase